MILFPSTVNTAGLVIGILIAVIFVLVVATVVVAAIIVFNKKRQSKGGFTVQMCKAK